MRFASSSPPSCSLALVLAAASASALSLALVSAVLKPRKRIGDLGEDIELFTKETERNEKILSSATDLLSEPWGFGNRHFASLLAQVRPSPLRGKKVRRRVEIITTPAGCDVEVEFVEPQNLDDQTTSSVPTIIILHGINGHSTEPYVEQAALHTVEKGWRAVVLNYAKVKVYVDETEKALGGQTLTDSGDLAFLISHLRKHHDGFLAAVGFSMGGSKLVHFLSRTREHCNLDAACSISSPLDFRESNDTVHRPDALIQRLYHFVITASLKLSLAKNYRELKKHPRLSQSQPFRRTPSGLMWWVKSNKVTDIDNAITIHAKGYRPHDLNKYYSDSSCIDNLRDSIQIPFLCLTAKNDPFVPTEILPGKDIANDNENIFILNTPRVGGHIGFWLPGRGCWATKACLSFFDSVRLHTASKARPKFLRRASSLRAAHYLQRTSSTGLTNYIKLVAHDSDYSLAFDEEEGPTMMSKREDDFAESTCPSMLKHFVTKESRCAQVVPNPLLSSFSSFVF